MLNNREWALIIWSLIALAVVLRNRGVREAVKALFEALLNRRLVFVFLLSLAYIAVGLGLWSLAGLYNSAQIKPALLWALIGAPTALARVGTAESHPLLLKSWVADTFKIAVLIEFVAHFYTFPIAVELVLIPISFLLAMLLAYSSDKPEYAKVKRVLNGALVALGGSLILYGFYSALRQFSTFATATTLSDFYTTPLLAFWMTPFLYIVFLYARYGSAHSVARIYITDRKLRDFAFAYAMIAFHVRTDLLRRWSQKIAEMSPRTRDDVKASIKRVLKTDQKSYHRKPVLPNLGWDPNEAGGFLSSVDLTTNDYHESFGDCFSESPMRSVTHAWPQDYMKYSVNGSADIADRLHLKLFVNSPAEETTALTAFRAAAKRLFELAFTAKDHEALQECLDLSQHADIELDLTRLTIERTPHLGANPQGFDLSLQLRR